MYIRRTSIKSRKDGRQYYTYRLVESHRSGKNVKQRTILNLGKNFSLPRDQWPDLVSRIEELISGQKSLFPTSKNIEKLAQHYAALIIQSHQHREPGDDALDLQEVDLSSLQIIRPRSVGAEHTAMEAFDSLKIDKKLKELGFNGPQIAAATGAIIGRMCFPASELATHYWLQEVSGLGELIDYDFSKTSLYRMYQISDQLLKHKEVIEAHLYSEERNLFGFEETITLYDLTNTYFEGSCKSNTLAAHGHSKEKRSDCPLVTLAMVLDSSGFPKRTEVFKGNANESETMAEMILKLETTASPGLFEQKKATIILDAGIATEDNVKWLQSHNYHYIVVSRKRHREFNNHDAVIVKEDDACTVKVQKTLDKETGETLLYCHSTRKEMKEQAIADRFIERFEDEIKKLASGLHKKGCTKKYDKVLERIGRIKQKYSKAAKQYQIDVEKDDKTGNAIKIGWLHRPAPETTETLPGVYCLRTSHENWDENQLWHTYTMLTDLEAVFRSLKTELGLRPVYHQTTDRVTGHLFITVLAYHLVHVLRLRLKEKGINETWENLRRQLTGQNRVTVTMQNKNGNMIHVRKSTRPEPRHQKIYSALGIKGLPGRSIKTIIKK
jgi:transposase